jgi:hypothetical protein
MTKSKLDKLNSAYALQQSDWQTIYQPIMIATGKSMEEIKKAEVDYFKILETWYNKEREKINGKKRQSQSQK